MVACRMTNNSHQHTSVLLNEVIDNLVIKPNGIYVDATFGRGGHSQAILKNLGPTGRLLTMDKDHEAIAYAKQYFSKDKRFVIQQGAFSKLGDFIQSQDLTGKVDGILFDLGVSSPQLDNPERGFSFQHSGRLDMRMDSGAGVDAASWLATISEKDLATVLWEFGEERFSRRIAKVLVTERSKNPIHTTEQLAKLISDAIPFKEKGKHPATRSFQAIRIAVNQELEELESVLNQALEVLTIGGRLLVISFHSLEDRIVKQFIQHHERGDNFPAKLPVKKTEYNPRLKRLGKAIRSTPEELAHNPRARSATLRIAEKRS